LVALSATSLDGRRLRRQNNREAVLEALLELFAEGMFEPNANDIADRAGISARSLFRYFTDVADLSRAAIEHELAKARLVEPRIEPAEPTATKIDKIIDARVQRFEAIAPAARAARISEHRNPVVAEQLHTSRAHLRNQLRRAFAPELARNDSAMLPAIDALCSFETYDLMRNEHGLSRAKTTAALTNALTALLDAA
jgi:TetR/AcrR family transcriptional regulator of autoinduction and epiphytic fitness